MKLYKNEVMVYIIKEKLGAFSSFTCCNIQNDCKMEKITLSKIMMMMMMMMMMITMKQEVLDRLTLTDGNTPNDTQDEASLTPQNTHNGTLQHPRTNSIATEDPTAEKEHQDTPNHQHTTLRSRNEEGNNIINTETYHEKLLHNYSLFLNTNPTRRPRLPKLKFSYKTKAIINKVNDIIQYHIENIMSLSELHTLIYASAYTILELNDQEVSSDPPNETCKKNNNKKPKWQIRLENKISKLRRDIGKLTQKIKGNIKSSKTEIYIQHLLQNYNSTNIEIILDTLKHKLQAYTH
jgi:hypothetical protein